MDLSSVHPSYAAHQDEWREAWDFLRAGRYVTHPSREVGRVSFLSVALESDDTESPARRRALYESVPARSYLFSHVRENMSRWSDRQARAVHFPLFRNLVEIYASSVLRVSPYRDANAHPAFRTFWSDVDLNGTSISVFVRRALHLALGLGAAYAVVDKPSVEAPASSRAEQLERNERTYAYLITPLELVDYSLDPYGGFEWAKVIETDYQSRMPWDAPAKVVFKYRVWYKDHWELYRQDKSPSKHILAAEGEHNFGRVPIARLRAARETETGPELASASLLSDFVAIDRSILNQLSLVHEQIYLQCFNILAIPRGDEGPSQLEVGAGSALLFDGTQGTPLYLAPNPAIIEVQIKAIETTLAWARQLASVGRGRAEHSKEERSASSLLVETEDKHNVVSSLAESIEDFEREISELVAIGEGLSLDAIPDIGYSRDVSLKSLQQRIDDALQLQNLNLPIDALKRLYGPIYTQALREHGLSADVIQSGLTSIESMKDGIERSPVQPL